MYDQNKELTELRAAEPEWAAVPAWVSWLGVAGAGALAVWAWHLAVL